MTLEAVTAQPSSHRFTNGYSAILFHRSQEIQKRAHDYRMYDCNLSGHTRVSLHGAKEPLWSSSDKMNSMACSGQ
eukprot:m.475261 g.475261  ORF g.475261 m.475261 type:complete len:75 (-) comp37996_c0_seq1:354-578(-)